MKKCTTILLLSAMLLSLLSACHSRVNYPADVFYSDELLASCLMEEMPVPKLENSRLNGERLCLNLTDEEYLAYVGPEMKWSAALWSPQHRELVLYCPETGSDALLRTVWHEALHQHLDYACSMIQSPAWSLTKSFAWGIIKAMYFTVCKETKNERKNLFITI